MHAVDQIKKIIRQHTRVETVTFFLYSRVHFFILTVRAVITNACVTFLNKLTVKKDIAGIMISKTPSVRLRDGRTYLWDPKDRNSLLGLPYYGEWEPEETHFIKHHVKNGDTVIDIGANYGYYTILFSKLVGPSGSVHAFEPLSDMVSLIRRNIELNNLDNNVHIVNKGLSNHKSDVMLYTYKELGSGATSASRRWFGACTKHRAHMITLDAYVKQQRIRKVHFIKCDVEGAEMLVFQGSKNVLLRDQPTILFEITNARVKFGYSQKDIFSFLEKYNYLFYQIQNNRLIRIQNPETFFGDCIALSHRGKSAL